MEKQHNRGQDGAGFASIKMDMQPGERYMSRVRSAEQQPIQDIFAQINNRINTALTENPERENDVDWQKKNIPYIGELLMGHVRSPGCMSIFILAKPAPSCPRLCCFSIIRYILFTP